MVYTGTELEKIVFIFFSFFILGLHILSGFEVAGTHER
jgi:hypothetical protein